MKTVKKVLCFVVILGLVTACHPQKKLVSINRETDTVELHVGQPCEIEFRTNASTGYWWQWVNGDEITVVDSTGKRYENHAPKNMVGAPSLLFWKFTAKEKGTQTLKFIYARNKPEEAIKTRNVTVTVK